ncbi:hypothetical protein ABL78_2262 [Leptomonas seymouri]|uniref:Uncharacterized protein n=1 Tax=Leptomonas seymouri TaxID=5684 RepID=A0A0N1I9G9_LEPSE|nr:hypothetical protein ABL78_2262 [Leptomonas seymouri]|eukprot:KPI88658.1 hypothetical protein ABL78_2262 [Leptomonas seymouri]
MSRAFVDDDPDYDASPRVNVNNMNTPHATVTLPERPTNKRVLMRGYKGNSEPMGASYTGSHVLPDKDALASSQAPTFMEGGDTHARSGMSQNLELSTARGDAVHPNLQEIYNRIMRRLQRQMNYAELSHATLAEQYGVDLELQFEEEEAVAAAENTQKESGERGRRPAGAYTTSQPATPTSSQTSPARADSESDALVEESRLTSRSPSTYASRLWPRGSSINNSNLNEVTGAMEPLAKQSKGANRGAAGGPSRLLQFKQRPLPATGSITSAFGDANTTSGGRSYAAVEREMAEQPCPRPLRLVVQHVLDTLQKKLTLAENGSLRDCIIFSFESRALLDRLLKEIPLYTQYTAYSGAPGSNGGVSSVAVQQAVSGVYQKLRKLPQLLPRGEYVEDAATGAIRAELMGNGTDYGGGNSGARGAGGALSSAVVVTHLPDVNALPITASNIGNINTANYSLSGHSQLPEVPLPAGYGKSSRLVASAALNDAASPSERGRDADYGNDGSTAALGGFLRPQRSFRHAVLRDHLSSANDSVSLGAAETFGDVCELTASGYGENRMGSSFTRRGNSRNGRVLQLAAEAAAAHRATQLVSVGTITEENSVTTVPQSEYISLQQRMDELRGQLADAQQHRSALAEQLCEEEQYTNQKKRIVQYLRETLVRECNMLRMQLHHANTTSSSPFLATGKGTHSQRATAIASTALHKENSTVGGLNASTQSHVRPSRLLSSAVSVSSTTAGPLMSPKTKSSYDRTNCSGSLGSIHGGNSNTVPSTSGGGSRWSNNRASPKFRHTDGGSSRNSPSGPPLVANTRSDAIQVEVDAVHSLIDLALLAVEEEAVLPPHATQQLQSGHGDKDVLRRGFHKNAKQQLDDLRVDFEGRQHALKTALLQQTAEHNYVVAEQQAEMERLRSLTDLTRVRAILQESVSEIRAELSRVRMQVGEQLHFFKAVLQNTGQSLLHRAALVDSTMSDNVTLSLTLNATRELIESANSLFLPMLTHEYECGYHPWPLKMRNTRDPLSHLVQLRFGSSEVVRLRDSLNEFGKLYVAIHQYVMEHAVVPDSTRPATGRPLEYLSAALALNPMSYTDTVFAARRCHDVECQLRKKLARLQSRILWNAYLQRVYVERSFAALIEAGIDPRVTMLPAARRIDLLAQQRGDMLQARVKMQRERSENAKELYRLWREKEIDIMEGYPTPQTQRNQLTLLNSSGPINKGESGEAVKASWKTARLSTLLKQSSVDGNGSAGPSST